MNGVRRLVRKILPDGTGRIRIHWFVRDAAGPIETPRVVLAVTALGPLHAGGVRGRVACQPQRTSLGVSQTPEGPVLLESSDDVRAVTCPECMSRAEFYEAKKALAEIVNAEITPEESIHAAAVGVQL